MAAPGIATFLGCADEPVSFTYSLFGLQVRSNLAIPQLSQQEPGAKRADVVLNWGASPTHAWADAKHERLIYQSALEAGEGGPPAVRVSRVENEGPFHLVYFDGAEFWLDGAGETIWARWPETTTLENAATYLTGPVLGLLLRLRGVTCLHASAVAMGNRAIAFVGPEGAGKSTTAAALVRRGFAALADDVVTLTERGGDFLVMPAYPYLCLWPDSAEKVAGPVPLPHFTPDWEKRCFPLGTPEARFEDRALPLGAIYILGERTSGGSPGIKALAVQTGLFSLVASTFATNLLDAQMRANELAVLGRLVSTVRIRKLHLREDSVDPGELCDLLIEDLRDSAGVWGPGEVMEESTG